jgi:hypothetical protein
MNRLLANPLDKERVKGKLFVFLSLLCLLPVLLNTLIIVPIYASLESNVLYHGSLVSVLIKYLQDFFDLCAFSSSYALLIFSALLLERKQTATVVIFYSVTFVLQIPLKILINALIYGSLGNDLEIVMDAVYLSVYFGLQMLQLLAVYVLTSIDSGKFKLYAASLDDPKVKSRIEEKKILPLSRLIDWNNPLQRSAIKMSALILAIKLITRIINDISYGAPESLGEVLIMIVYYLSDLIYGAVAYFIAIFVISRFYETVKKKNGAEAPLSSDGNEN